MNKKIFISVLTAVLSLPVYAGPNPPSPQWPVGPDDDVPVPVLCPGHMGQDENGNIYCIGDYTNCAAGEVGEPMGLGCNSCPAGYTSDARTVDDGGCYSFYTPGSQEYQSCLVEKGYCYRETVNLTNSTTCDVDNLETSANGSTAQTEAIWNANTININWYNGDTRVAQNTCTYDGQITLPAQPSKPGYTFAGWRLKTTE